MKNAVRIVVGVGLAVLGTQAFNFVGALIAGFILGAIASFQNNRNAALVLLGSGIAGTAAFPPDFLTLLFGQGFGVGVALLGFTIFAVIAFIATETIRSLWP